MRRLSLSVVIIIVVLGRSHAGKSPASIVGRTLDCFAGVPIRPADIDIYLFDPARASSIVKILERMQAESASGGKGTEKFLASYLELAKEVQRTSALGHVKSDKSGAFSFQNLTFGHRVLVLGLTELEDEPAYYAYKMLDSLNAGENKLVLDFYDDGVPCGKPKANITPIPIDRTRLSSYSKV